MLEIVGSVIVAPPNCILINKNGDKTLLQDDDKIHFGDTIKNENQTQNAELNLINGNDIFVKSGNCLHVDRSVVVDESFGNEGVLSHESLAYLLDSQNFDSSLNLDDILHNHANTSHSNGVNILDIAPEKNISIDDNINTDF